MRELPGRPGLELDFHPACAMGFKGFKGLGIKAWRFKALGLRVQGWGSGIQGLGFHGFRVQFESRISQLM